MVTEQNFFDTKFGAEISALHLRPGDPELHICAGMNTADF
jgi:hypothetical protein